MRGRLIAGRLEASDGVAIPKSETNALKGSDLVAQIYSENVCFDLLVSGDTNRAGRCHYRPRHLILTQGRRKVL